MNHMSSRAMVALSIVATVLILIANLGMWLQQDIFNKGPFVKRTVKILQQKPVREAIAAEAVDVAFADLPTIQALVDDFLESSLSALLDTEIIERAVEELAGQIYDAMTAREPKAVGVDIKSVTGPLKSIVPEIPGIDSQIKVTVKDLPDSIVLIKRGEIPSFYSMKVFSLWAGPIGGLAALALFASVIWGAGVGRRSAALKIIGATLGVGAALFFLFVRAYQVPMLSSVDGNIKIILESIYDSFTAGLITQTRWLLVIAVLIVATGFLIDLLSPRFKNISK